MWTYIQNTLPNFFADDLACVIGATMGLKYSQQCLDLERRLKKLFEYLEYYAVVSVQPINYSKTEVLWTARAIGNPKFELYMGDNKISWVKNFKYLGYYISCKLGWSKMISFQKLKIRQRVAIVRSCRMYGSTSPQFRKTIFSTYVRPLFTWLFGIFPLLTECQKDDLSHFYFVCLKRTIGGQLWNDILFASLFEERSLVNLCNKYWRKYSSALRNSTDGFLLFEQQSLNSIRSQWVDKEFPVKCIYRSKRIVPHTSIIEKCLRWLENSDENSIPYIPENELDILVRFPNSFLWVYRIKWASDLFPPFLGL